MPRVLKTDTEIDVVGNREVREFQAEGRHAGEAEPGGEKFRKQSVREGPPKRKEIGSPERAVGRQRSSTPKATWDAVG